MKNIFKIFLLSALIFAVGCENEDDPRFQDNPETGWLEFQSASTTSSVNSSTESIDVRVLFTAPINLSNLDVTYSVSDVMGSASDVTNNLGGTLRIGANTNEAVITFPLIAGADLALASGDISFDIVLTGASRGVPIGLSDGSRTTTHTVNLVCDLDLAQFFDRSFSVTTDYGFHDFLPAFNQHTETTTIDVVGDRQYFVQDFSGGLYNGGPYTDNYGTGPTSADVTFSNACTNIVWENQSDPWGSITPTAGGTNSIDINTGVVTISWTFNGYGENGVSVYTPN